MCNAVPGQQVGRGVLRDATTNPVRLGAGGAIDSQLVNRSEWSTETTTDATNRGYLRTYATSIDATRRVFSAAHRWADYLRPTSNTRRCRNRLAAVGVRTNTVEWPRLERTIAKETPVAVPRDWKTVTGKLQNYLMRGAGRATARPATDRGRLDAFGEPARLVEPHFPFMHFAGHIGRREPDASNVRRAAEKSRPAGACKPVEPHITVRA
jgi:hypothetical protein